MIMLVTWPCVTIPACQSAYKCQKLETGSGPFFYVSSVFFSFAKLALLRI